MLDRSHLSKSFWIFFFFFSVFKLSLIHWYEADTSDSIAYVNWDLIGKSKWSPLYPFLMQIVQPFFEEPLIAGRFVAIVSSLVLAIFLFRLTCDLYGAKAAWITLALYTVAPIPMRWSLRSLTEATFCLLLFLCLRKTHQYFLKPSLNQLGLLGVWGALGALTRPEGLGFLIFFVSAGVHFIFFWKKKWDQLFFLALGVGLWVFVGYWYFGLLGAEGYFKEIGQGLEANRREGGSQALSFLYYYLLYGFYTLGFFVAIFGILGFWKSWLKPSSLRQQRRFWQVICFAWAVCLMAILAVHIGWSTRFLYSLAVLILPFVGFFLAEISSKSFQRSCVILSLLAYTILSGAILYHQKQLFGDMKRLGHYIKNTLNENDRVFFNEDCILPYYSHRKYQKITNLRVGDYIAFSNFWDVEKQLEFIQKRYQLKLIAVEEAETRPLFSDDVFVYPYYREDGTIGEGGNANIPISTLDLLWRKNYFRSILVQVISKVS